MKDKVDSLPYYENHSQSCYERTIHIDMSGPYQKFFTHLSEKSYILDVGCGVGRDTKLFLEKGHKVFAFDGSAEMVKLTKNETGHEARQMLFQEVDFHEEFAAVWASAALLACAV